jgi:hypothetical protein
MSDELPMCACDQYWPGQPHHPDCPVRREITALRAEVADLRLQLDAQAIEANYARADINDLRMTLSARDAEVRALREKADELLRACDDSDGAQYGTLATKFVRSVLTGEPGPGGEV